MSFGTCQCNFCVDFIKGQLSYLATFNPFALTSQQVEHSATGLFFVYEFRLCNEFTYIFY